VGAATWSHTMRSVRPGGTVVVVGATSGDPTAMEVSRLFFQEITVVGATMGTRDELAQLVAFVDRAGIEPPVDSSFALADARQAFGRLAGGAHFGKVVVRP
jgi:D-arabinose 1-dehydrogenase-like Zn-dependent alcohol dehydrogenase